MDLLTNHRCLVPFIWSILVGIISAMFNLPVVVLLSYLESPSIMSAAHLCFLFIESNSLFAVVSSRQTTRPDPSLRSDPSAAQWCPDDILGEIFRDLPLRDVSQASIVCKGWLHSSRTRLYTWLSVDCRTTAGISVSAVLRDSPVLRTYIRRLQIIRSTKQDRSPPVASVDWLSLLSQGGIWTLDVEAWDDDEDFLAYLLHLQFIAKVQRITLRGEACSYEGVLDDCLTLPELEVLAYRQSWLPEALNLSRIPPLKHLSVTTTFYPPYLADLLIAVSGTLRKFDLHLDELSATRDLAQLTSVLVSHCTRIPRLSIRVNMQTPPFLDDVVGCLPMLEYLSCGWGTYSAAIFSRIHRKLGTLNLQSLVWRKVPILELDSALVVVERARKGEIGLHSLVVTRHADQTHVEEVTEACRGVGLVFACHPYDISEDIVEL